MRLIFAKVSLIVVGSLILIVTGFYFRKNRFWAKTEFVEIEDEKINGETWEEKFNFNQKLGQMFIVGIEGKVLTDKEINWLGESKIGGVILLSKNIEDEEQLYNLTQEINKTATISGIRPFVSVDQEGGVVTRIPFIENTAQGEIQNSFQALNVSMQRSLALKKIGINVNFAPVLEPKGEKGSFIDNQNRSFSENDFLLSETIISGCNEVGIWCVVKHFPGGLSKVKIDPHYQLPRLETDRNDLRDEVLRFEKAIEAGARAIMVTHIDYPKIDDQDISSASKVFIGEILRNELNFEGLVFIDDIGMGAVMQKYEILDFLVNSIKAGANQLIVTDQRLFEDVWPGLIEIGIEDMEMRSRVEESFLIIDKEKSRLEF